MKKRILSALLMFAMMISLVACSGQGEKTGEPVKTGGASEETEQGDGLKTIKIAITADIVPMTDRVVDALAELGYKMDITVYEDYVMPNQALMEGSFDCNFMQHEPYMDDFNASHDGDLVMISPKIVYTPFLLCSKNIKSIDDIPNGATIAIPNSPSIREHALSALTGSGLITLADKPKDNNYFGIVDIVDNPLNLQFVEVDLWASQAMMEETDLVCTSSDQFDMNGVDVQTALYRETAESAAPYAWGIAVRSGDENAEWVQTLNEAFHSDSMREALERDYPGVYGFTD